jgi:hypothetical protein
MKKKVRCERDPFEADCYRKKIFFTLIMNIQLFHCRMLSSLSQSLGFARAYELHNSITGARRRGVRDYIIVKKFVLYY